MNFFKQLGRFSAPLAINAKNIEILHTPKAFYETLISRNRISIASLYIGHEEKELISALVAAAKTKKKVDVLMDYSRGIRGPSDCVSALKGLLEEKTASLSLFHCPQYPLLRKSLPNRIKEVLGVMHLKAYVFDDTVILSGRDYFVNRQDRYFVIRNEPLFCQYVLELLETTRELSFKVKRNTFDLPSVGIDPQVMPTEFKKEAHDRYSELIRKWELTVPNSTSDTLVYPGIQFGAAKILQESDLLNAVVTCLQNASPPTNLFLASGYFNLLKSFERQLLSSKAASCQFLVASPQANGFLNSSGISKNIPFVYSHLQEKFMKRLRTYHRQKEFKVNEFQRQGWTFHAKGIWAQQNNLPILTSIGSSNLGLRSHSLDLECQYYFVTENKELQMKLKSEISTIYADSLQITDEEIMERNRQLPFWVRRITPFVKKFF